MQRTMERPATDGGARTRGYATLLVHAEPEQASSRRVEAAARLARDLDARLIGLGAETFDASLFSGPFTGVAAGQWAGLVQDQIKHDLGGAEAAFHRDAAGADIEWRAVQDHPHRALIGAAHAADLIVVSPRCDRTTLQAADPADVVMDAGRPVLVVPESGPHLVGASVIVAWKNTPECRRALADALPLLQRAETVVVLALVKPDASSVATFETGDVVANLKRHGVNAQAMVAPIDHGAAEAEIERFAREYGADLIVAGAFGTSRLREWAFGGVTDSFLNQPSCHVLLSH